MANPKQPSVLVVDDTEQNRYVVSHVLQRAGIAVTECATGHAALELASRQPDVILLDVKLPDMSGYEVCRKLKADKKTAAIPVLLISAFMPEGQTNQMVQAGADGYLPQPVDPKELVAKIQKLIGAKAAKLP